MKSQEELDRIDDEARTAVERESLPPISITELEAIYRKWMIIPDKGIIRFILACYVANKIPGKAVWAFVIGPSGGGKTELLHPLTSLGDVVSISALTPNTFLSGMPGKNDASLLPKLSGKVMLCKDWTSILSMQKDAKSDLMGQFREIHDGEYTKTFGTGQTREWKGKVTLIAASTQAIDLNQQQFTHLGERFLSYRPIMPDRKTVARKSLDNDRDQELMQKEMANACFAFVKGIDYNKYLKDPIKLSEEFKNEVVNLANFCTMARSGIIRDFGFKKEVIFVPAPEMPTRITSQLSKLVVALMIINQGTFRPEDMEIIYKVALDSIPQTNKMVISELAKADDQTTAEIATALGYPTDPIRIYLENLALLKVCKRIKGSGGPDKWTMEPEFSAIIRHYEKVEELTDEQRQNRKIEADIDSAGVAADLEFERFGAPTP